MRLALSPRAERLLGRLPRPTVYSAAELVLLGLLAVQSARLIWICSSPLGPVGDWRAPSRSPRPPTARSSAASIPSSASAAPAGPVVVTALNLKLYGVRQDQATGRGSAIIALPDGRQLSFAVGEEIVPGVTLTAVGFDSVTISRGGARRADLPRPVDSGAVTVARRPAAPVRRRRRQVRRRRRCQPGAGPSPRRRPGSRSASAADDGGRVTGVMVSPGGAATGRFAPPASSPATSSSRSTASASPRSSRRRAATRPVRRRGQCHGRARRPGGAAAGEVESVKRVLIALALCCAPLSPRLRPACAQPARRRHPRLHPGRGAGHRAAPSSSIRRCRAGSRW